MPKKSGKINIAALEKNEPKGDCILMNYEVGDSEGIDNGEEIILYIIQ